MTPLLFLPGMMCDARLFSPQIAAIHDRAVMVTPIIAHDNMEDLAAEILAHAPPTFALAGLSMGGIVAMEVLRQAPERVERVALMDTNPLAEADEVKARRDPQMEAVRKGGLEGLLDVMRKEMMPYYLAAQSPCQNEILTLCEDMAVANGPEVFLRQSVALRNRQDQRSTLTAYKKPTLILQGEEDQLCPSHRHEMMHELIPHAEYEVIKHAGHLPPLEQPEMTMAALSCWLEL